VDDCSYPYGSQLAGELLGDVLERFLRYVRIDTQSDRAAAGYPSTAKQLDLIRLLADELRALGLDDVEVTEHGYVFATVPGIGVDHGPTVGLIAHVDTSPDAPGAGVDPQVWRSYDGGEIRLPRDPTQVISPATSPLLAQRIGHDLVTSDGTTLLGADDKAGVAEIMAAVAHLAAHPEVPRPTLRIGFTPDEEIGQGASRFDVARFGARCAYTLDGSAIGELQDETFTGAEAIVTIHGVEVHPGFATGKLVSAARLAGRLLAALPADLTPEATDGRRGFIHVYDVSATAGKAVIRAIVRDFDDDLLADHVALLRATAEEVVASEPRARLEIDVRQQYPNMRSHLEPFPEIVEAAEQAIRDEGLEPLRTPIRGGTDGSMLSAMGLPTPNLFTGGHEYHSVREWASVQDMAAAAATVVRLAEVWARR
jgi:tripeptide aminopeptidase